MTTTEPDTEPEHDEHVVPEAEGEPTVARSRTSVGSAGRWLLPVLTVAVVLLAAATACLVVDRVGADRRAADEGQIVAIARQTALNLTSTDPNSANATFAHLQEAATGDFAAQLASQSDSFVRVIQSAGVTSTSTIGESGIERLDGDSAVVLVVVDAVVKNAQTPDGEPRVWRMRMNLQRQADARWLVSGLDFVA